MSSHVAGRFINRLRFDLDANEIKKLSEEVMSKVKSTYDTIANIGSGSHTFDNTIKPIAEMEADVYTQSSNLTFPAHTSTDKQIRDASSDAEKAFSAFSIEQTMREDVYKSVLKYTEKKEKLDAQQTRLLERVVRDFKRNGLHLGEKERTEIKEIKTRMSDLCILFQKNVNEDQSSVSLTLQEIEGVPEDVLK
eukprot:TRINITY_DN3178_c0_g1_i1.p1 TRINITY_DN3178_c0_g1~~TRINITY_DN3178_c0_g1_i1.p1  ORF type:complete len:193 (+),score=44.81 TRINITY_DN3178_c0_g1_i1:24-602(+)